MVFFDFRDASYLIFSNVLDLFDDIGRNLHSYTLMSTITFGGLLSKLLVLQFIFAGGIGYCIAWDLNALFFFLERL